MSIDFIVEHLRRGLLLEDQGDRCHFNAIEKHIDIIKDHGDENILAEKINQLLNDIKPHGNRIIEVYGFLWANDL